MSRVPAESLETELICRTTITAMQLELWSARVGAKGALKEGRARARVQTPRAELVAATVHSTLARDLDALAVRAEQYVRDAKSERTRQLYRTDWRTFERWCEDHGVRALPATPATLACYLTHLAELGRRSCRSISNGWWPRSKTRDATNAIARSCSSDLPEPNAPATAAESGRRTFSRRCLRHRAAKVSPLQESYARHSAPCHASCFSRLYPLPLACGIGGA